MVLSGKLIKFPYWLCWQFHRLLGKLHGTVFYVEYAHDYHIFENILPHLDTPFRIAAKNRALARELGSRGIKTMVWPVFPETLIMARHALHRFPINNIHKIGMMHGPYYFKKMVRAERYIAFDLYLFTSAAVLNQAKEKGITNGVVGGYPRIDAFRDAETIRQSHLLGIEAGLPNGKKTLLFTATWDRSGQSAVHKWIDRLRTLKARYNIVVSLHPMMSKSICDKLRSMKGIFVAAQHQLYAYMLLSDILISDTSSIIAEFCALDKPVITFSVGQANRLTPDIQAMIRDVSIQISSLEELDGAVERFEREPGLKKEQREKWNRLIYQDTKISHGKMAAEIMNGFIRRRAAVPA